MNVSTCGINIRYIGIRCVLQFILLIVIDELNVNIALLGYGFTITTYNSISYYHVIIKIREPCRSSLSVIYPISINMLE